MPLAPSETPLTEFKLLSFDVYGTLIDWEGGMYNALSQSPPFSRLPPDHALKDRKTLLLTYDDLERKLQASSPELDHKKSLAKLYKAIIEEKEIQASAEEIDTEAEKFADSVGEWPVFPDTLDALYTLKKHYHLVPLTNCSRETFGGSLRGPFKNFPFSAYYTAGDIGSYKPNLRNFHYLLEHVKSEFGVEKGEVLHVAQSKYHDHVPAKKMGLESCWVNRNGFMGEEGEKDAGYGWEVKTLGELAGLVEETFGEAK